jgi:hypothetical protein
MFEFRYEFNVEVGTEIFFYVGTDVFTVIEDDE